MKERLKTQTKNNNESEARIAKDKESRDKTKALSNKDNEQWLSRTDSSEGYLP